jgi:putative tricarboxylic transport membrane protein
MTRIEKIVLFLWLSFAIFVAVESWRMGVGNFRTPGPGFMTFGVSLILALLVVGHAWEQRGKKSIEQAEPLFKGKKVKNILLGFGFLFTYPFLMPVIGFSLCNLVFIGLCLKVIGGKSWRTTAVASIGTAVAAYFLFDVWLSISFPKVIWVSRLQSLGGF